MKIEIQKLKERQKTLESEISSPSVLSNPQKLAAMGKELSTVNEALETAENLEKMKHDLEESKQGLKESTDTEYREMLNTEVETLTEKIKTAESLLEELLTPQDPYDNKNVIMEIRAGKGGE